MRVTCLRPLRGTAGQGSKTLPFSPIPAEPEIRMVYTHPDHSMGAPVGGGGVHHNRGHGILNSIIG